MRGVYQTIGEHFSTTRWASCLGRAPTMASCTSADASGRIGRGRKAGCERPIHTGRSNFARREGGLESRYADGPRTRGEDDVSDSVLAVPDLRSAVSGSKVLGQYLSTPVHRETGPGNRGQEAATTWRPIIGEPPRTPAPAPAADSARADGSSPRRGHITEPT